MYLCCPNEMLRNCVSEPLTGSQFAKLCKRTARLFIICQVVQANCCTKQFLAAFVVFFQVRTMNDEAA